MNYRNFFTTNRWWGKMIGAFLGYIFGGPAGALLGILIGNFIDRSLKEHFSHPYWHYHVEKRQLTQKVFFEATFSVIGHLAKADGHVSQQEINMANRLMHEMGLTKQQQIAAQNFFKQGKASHFDLAGMLSRLLNICHDNPELLKLFMDIQYRAALTDGLSAKKVQVLDTIFRRMGFAPLNQQYRFYADFGNQHADYSSSQHTNNQRNYSYNRSRAYQAQPDLNNLAHAYALLELSPNANKQETKKAYRRLISRNHPDKLIAQGLPEEMIKIANEKTQKITKAYEQICASKGW